MVEDFRKPRRYYTGRVKALVEAGHKVIVESEAGRGGGIADSGCSAFAYEMVRESNGSLPLLTLSGLDPVNVELLKATVTDLRKQGTTILFSSHRMDHVEELCQNICILDKSNTVLQGNLQQIKNSF